MTESGSIPESDLENFASFLNNLMNESDRGAALIAAAMCDELLRRLLHNAMRPGKAILKRLFDYPGPLSAFSARIDIARAFGLLSEKEHRILVHIKTIRSKHAAHTHELFSFDNPQVKHICEELGKHAPMLPGFPVTSRSRFMSAVATVHGHVLSQVVVLERARKRHPGKSLLEMHAPIREILEKQDWS